MNENKGVSDVPYFVYEAELTRMERERNRLIVADIMAAVALIVSNFLWYSHVFG